MTMRISQDIAAAMCDAGVAKFTAGGAGTSKLQIMSGAKPATLGTALGAQKVLVAFDLPDALFDPATPTAGGATATANDVPSSAATADAGAGTQATWWRVLDKGGAVVADGDCSDTTGNADMKLANTTIVSGIDVTIVSWTAFHPI